MARLCRKAMAPKNVFTFRYDSPYKFLAMQVWRVLMMAPLPAASKKAINFSGRGLSKANAGK